MKTRVQQVCSILLSVLLVLVSIPRVWAGEESVAAEPITVSIHIFENTENQSIVQPLTLSCPDGTTAAGLLALLKKYAYLMDYQWADGVLTQITAENGERIGGDGHWFLQMNGAPIEEGNIPVLQDGDAVEWIYQANPDASSPVKEEEPMLEVASVSTPSLWNDRCSTALKNACAWLKAYDERRTAFISLGAAGVSVDYRSIDTLMKAVSAPKTYASAAEVADDILAVTFCGIYAGDVAGENLLTTLSNYPDISRGGNLGAIFALLAADSNAYRLQGDGINTRATLRAVVLSAQNDDGGFAATRGGESSPYVTAYALIALARYQADAEIREVLDNGFAYLSGVQLEDGSFPATEDSYSAAQTTGAVLTALCAAGISPDDERFSKKANPLEALLEFQTESGGFAAVPGVEPSADITEEAVLALVAVKGNRSSYLLRTKIEGEDAVETPPESQSSVSSETIVPGESDVIRREKMLFGGLGLSVGILLGGMVLVVVLGIVKRKSRIKKKPPSNRAQK